MNGVILDLATRASTTMLDPSPAELSLAAKVGLPRGDAWLQHFAHLSGPTAADRSRIVSGGDLEKASRRGSIGGGLAVVETIDDGRRAIEAATALRRLGDEQAAKRALDLVSSAGNPWWFAAVARDSKCTNDAAILVIHRSVEIETVERDDDVDDLSVDYDLQVIVSASAGAGATVADAAIHAALARQFDIDMTTLGHCLAAAGYRGDVLCNVMCLSDEMQRPSYRIADLLRQRQGSFLEFADFDTAGFPDFREPSVLDF